MATVGFQELSAFCWLWDMKMFRSLLAMYRYLYGSLCGFSGVLLYTGLKKHWTLIMYVVFRSLISLVVFPKDKGVSVYQENRIVIWRDKSAAVVCFQTYVCTRAAITHKDSSGMMVVTMSATVKTQWQVYTPVMKGAIIHIFLHNKPFHLGACRMQQVHNVFIFIIHSSVYDATFLHLTLET